MRNRDLSYICTMVEQLFRLFHPIRGARNRGLKCSGASAIEYAIIASLIAVVILVELAGMKQEEIEAVADRDTLIIRGERKDTSQRGKRSYHRMEIRWGAFERGILLPTAIKTDETRATYKDGLLEIVVPKVQQEKAHTHKIKVRTSEAGGEGV